MLHVLTNHHRTSSPVIFRNMFRSRAVMFQEKLGWDVAVHDGLEYDDHDLNSDPTYVVLADHKDVVVGSLRLLPTTGDTMMTREFAHMFDEPIDVRSPSIWECTRFCVPHASDPSQHVAAGRASSELLIALCEFGLDHGIEHIVGLYEAPMTRIYRRIGWSPTLLARAKPEIGNLMAGIWDVTELALADMCRLAGRTERLLAS